MFKILIVICFVIGFYISSPAQQDMFSEAKRIDGGIEWRSTDAQRKIMFRCEFIDVQVSFIVLEDGSTSDIELEYSTHEELNIDDFVTAVSQFQYQPRIENGVAVKTGRMVQNLTFNPEQADHCQDFDGGEPTQPEAIEPD